MIEYKNVALRYTEKDVLRDVNLQIEDGEFMVLVGPSGSGKTTMLKMINRLLEPTDGNIYMDGKRIKDYDERELRLSTGYVLQAIALFPNLTVAENIALIPEMKGWSKEEITKKTEELLAKVGLPVAEYGHRLPSELSGGEQQRVGIVRAMIGQPKIFLMDEPFSALDAISRKQLQVLTKELHKEFGMTTIFVTHDTDEALKLADWVLQIAGIFQTIPSLALLGLFIPLMGIGTLPALTALVIYAIFPILQNTITGLKGIDPNLQEAGIAFGMTRWERLKKFEIPLAMPVIMSGIRTAAVLIIGTATLAALIGAGGLGSFILLGIDRNNASLILIGALSSAVLAIAFNFLLKVMEKAKLRTIFSGFALVALLLGLSYSPALLAQKEKENLIIAGKIGPEPEILANMYKLLIEENTSMTATVKPNFGTTSFLYEALKKGDIDIYPEFTGTVTESLLQPSPKVSHEPEQVYQVARDGIAKQDHLAYLKPMSYQNTYAVAVPKKIAQEYGLKTISDLKKVEGQLKAGFTLEFNDREDGNKGLQSMYGLNLNVATMQPALRYQAIQSGDIQITDAYSTDAELERYDLQVLEDDKQLFPPYQGAPLMKEALLKKHPELETVLNKLAGKITESQMSQLNYQVGVEGKPAEQVAKEFLQEQGLLKK